MLVKWRPQHLPVLNSFSRRKNKKLKLFLIIFIFCVYRSSLRTATLTDVRTGDRTYSVFYEPKPTSYEYATYEEALETKATSDKIILLMLVDYNYINFGINFYETSILSQGLKHYLFVCSDIESYKILGDLGIDRFLYARHWSNIEDDKVKHISIRLRFLYDALKLGFNVFVSDVDVYFVANH